MVRKAAKEEEVEQEQIEMPESHEDESTARVELNEEQRSFIASVLADRRARAAKLAEDSPQQATRFAKRYEVQKCDELLKVLAI